MRYPGEDNSAALVVDWITKNYEIRPLLGTDTNDIEALNAALNVVIFFESEKNDKVGKVLEVLKAKFVGKVEVVKLVHRKSLERVAKELSVEVSKTSHFFSLRVNDQSFYAYEGADDPDSIESHVIGRIYPPIFAFSLTVFEMYLGKYFSRLLVYFYKESEQVDPNIARMARGLLPDRYRGTYQVFLAEMTKNIFNQFKYDELGLKQLPVLVLFDAEDLKTERRFIYPSTLITKEKVLDFIEEFETGELPRYFKASQDSTFSPGLVKVHEILPSLSREPSL